jgi:hypothetical protein
VYVCFCVIGVLGGYGMESAVMRRIVLVGALAGFLVLSGSAFGASSVTLCVPSAEGAAITTSTKGSCGTGTSVALPSAKAEQEKLIAILPHINYVAEGLDKKPTVQFSGVNLQVINGSGSETTLNGTGNLLLGYDEKPKAQTGSHNLLLGGTENSYSSYGGIVGGAHNNTISGPYASVIDGAENTATGTASVITGGHSNLVNSGYSTLGGGCSNLVGTGTLAVSSICTSGSYPHYFASVTGGTANVGWGQDVTIVGGAKNTAGGLAASILGGKSQAENTQYGAGLLPYSKFIPSGVAGKPTVQFSGVNLQVVSGSGKTNAAVNGEGNMVIGYDEGSRSQTGSHNLILGGEQSFTSFGAILAGYKNSVSAPYGAITGGYGGTAEGELSSISGGLENIAKAREASVSGGQDNTASGITSSVSGGGLNVADELLSSVSGGVENLAEGFESSVSGGFKNRATGVQSSVTGGGEDVASGEESTAGGGFKNNAEGQRASVIGGEFNLASGRAAGVFGSEGKTATEIDEALL